MIDEEYGGEKKKNSWMFRIFKWIVYSVSLIVILITIYRFASMGIPTELKNYILASAKTEQAYAELKDDFLMYKFDILNAFGMGDAFHADSVYYLESVQNLQLTLRCKAGRFSDLFGSLPERDLIRPFKAYLKISEISGDDESESDANPDVVLESIDEAKFGKFGKNGDSYVYFVYSFDDVAVDYTKTKLELYVFDNTSETEALFDEDEYLARFTLFDVNMPKTKVQMKKFMRSR